MNKKNITPTITVILILSAFLFYFKLGNIGLFETSEGRYAEISREMLESSDFITPTLNGIKHFHKPPITYWLTSLGLKIFGINEFGARFFLAFFALLGLFYTYKTALCLFDENIASYSAIILMSSLLYMIFARSLTTDMYLTTFTIMCFYFLSDSYFNKNKTSIWKFWVVLSLAFLTKGPVPLMIIFLPIIVFSFIYKNSKLKKTLELKKGFFIFLIISLPWFIVVILKNDGLLKYFIDYQIIKRVASNVHHRTGPIYYFLVVILAGMFPWSLFIPEIFYRAYKKLKKDDSIETKKIILLVLTFLVPFIVFSVSRSKLPAYVLPLFPILSILIAYAFDRFYYFNEFYKTMYAFVIANFILCLGITYFVFFKFNHKFDKISDVFILLCVISWIYAISTFLTFNSYNKKYIIFNIVFFITLSFFIVTKVIEKVQHNIHCMKLISEDIKILKKSDDKIINYKCFINSIPFYLQQKIILDGVNRETQFNETEDIEKIIKEKGVGKLIKILDNTQNFRYFVVCKKDDWEKIKRVEKFPKLKEYGKFILFWTGISKKNAIKKLLRGD